MVSLLARVCLFDEARAFIEKHHIERSAEVLRALLDGCWIHHGRNIETEAQRPASDVSLHDEDEERECIQIGHSEMLALSFALISTQPGAAIRFSKILRVLRMS
ncbi:hypothetical protein H0E87_003109 [Populus deltoides]|uniref:DYW domain-containing protein n=1 Tax=Populus deltoides TaxID=3696 RepID=A0A8T2ZY97_POPDE|nr:hypothetical protein H0E87_003109 [Populus deltoides]